jgi:glycine/D-amino acid oxidase-like deaminating enzyme
MEMVREVDYDIVVIGCGVAGTAAALSAAETAKRQGKRLKIAILERSDFDHRGGNSRWTASYMRMKNIDEIAELTDAQLVGLAKQGDREAFTELIHRHRRRCANLATSILRHRGERMAERPAFVFLVSNNSRNAVPNFRDFTRSGSAMMTNSK